MKLLKTFALLLVISSLFSCEVTEEEEEVQPNKTLTGKWVITNTNLLGTDIPEDGSYLSFSECSNSNCSGVDYKASDNSSSTFTYTKNAEISIVIDDSNTSKGGNYNGIWAIQSFSTNKLVLKKTTLFGNMIITLKK